jgi:acetoin utilization deacetylase AcuC-like enzyme
MSKYPLLKDLLCTEGLLTDADILTPEPLALETLALVHTPEYLEKLASGRLSAAEQRRLGLPWSEALWLRSRLAAAGTLLAARTALQEGLAGNLAGGTHHAFADHAEGFCVLNDVAISIAQLRSERLMERFVVIDLDVHQGNGTASIFEGDEAVFTFSMHGQRNYPVTKMRSSLDIGLADGTGDEGYLDELDRHLPRVLSESKARLAFYVAGVDVLHGDRYGKLSLTEQGLRQRDRRVIEAVRHLSIPLVIVPAGGYAETRERTALMHAHAYREAILYERGVGGRTCAS